jgi:hypothetical protein
MTGETFCSHRPPKTNNRHPRRLLRPQPPLALQQLPLRLLPPPPLLLLPSPRRRLGQALRLVGQPPRRRRRLGAQALLLPQKFFLQLDAALQLLVQNGLVALKLLRVKLVGCSVCVCLFV